jgi:hypothetical protein
MLTLPVDLPPKIESAQACFALATGLIYQGGGRITVAETARIAGMEERAFVEAASALGEELEEMIQQAYDAVAIAEAYEEMKKPGGEPITAEELCKSLGLDPKTL